MHGSPFAALAPLLLATLLGTTLPPGALAADSAGRILYRTVHLHGQAHRYAVWVPPGFHPSTHWPAILFLHGSGECGLDGEKPLHIGLGPALQAHPERWPFVVVFPQKPSEHTEWEEHEDLVFKVLEDAKHPFAIDPHRIALAGVSQGGHGAWMFGARHPEKWRCLVAVCGYGRARTVASRIAHLPVWAFHGLEDDVVDPADTQHIVAELRAQKALLGLDPGEARMTLYPDANHGSWDPAFAEPELPGWIAAHLTPHDTTTTRPNEEPRP